MKISLTQHYINKNNALKSVQAAAMALKYAKPGGREAAEKRLAEARRQHRKMSDVYDKARNKENGQ